MIFLTNPGTILMLFNSHITPSSVLTVTFPDVVALIIFPLQPFTGSLFKTFWFLTRMLTLPVAWICDSVSPSHSSSFPVPPIPSPHNAIPRKIPFIDVWLFTASPLPPFSCSSDIPFSYVRYYRISNTFGHTSLFPVFRAFTSTYFPNDLSYRKIRQSEHDLYLHSLSIVHLRFRCSDTGSSNSLSSVLLKCPWVFVIFLCLSSL